MWFIRGSARTTELNINNNQSHTPEPNSEGKYFLFIHNETFTNIINTGTSTKGPITPANACPEFNPKTAIETAIANSKLFPAAVKATDAVLS